MMGLGKRISYGLRCFFSILFHGEIPQSIALEHGEAVTVAVQPLILPSRERKENPRSRLTERSRCLPCCNATDD